MVDLLIAVVPAHEVEHAAEHEACEHRSHHACEGACKGYHQANGENDLFICNLKDWFKMCDSDYIIEYDY